MCAPIILFCNFVLNATKLRKLAPTQSECNSVAFVVDNEGSAMKGQVEVFIGVTSVGRSKPVSRYDLARALNDHAAHD